MILNIRSDYEYWPIGRL